jgi:hypothetical protein
MSMRWDHALPAAQRAAEQWIAGSRSRSRCCCDASPRGRPGGGGEVCIIQARTTYAPAGHAECRSGFIGIQPVSRVCCAFLAFQNNNSLTVHEKRTATLELPVSRAIRRALLRSTAVSMCAQTAGARRLTPQPRWSPSCPWTRGAARAHADRYHTVERGASPAPASPARHASLLHFSTPPCFP